MTRLLLPLTEEDVKCIPGYCENLEVKKTGELWQCYCTKLKRIIEGDEWIKFPKGCPHEWRINK